MSRIIGCPNNFEDTTYYENENIKKCNQCNNFTYEDGILTCKYLLQETNENNDK